jgi:hypothetical protein
MFWYLHPLKTCKLVPISLKHVRLGANQVPHSLYPNHRVESESKTYLYHGTTQTFARARGLFQITDQVGSGKESMAPKRSHSAGGGREASASCQTSQQRRGRSCQPRRGRSCCAQVCAAGGKEQRDQLQGAGGGPGNGSEDGSSSGSDDGAAGRGAVDRQRTPEQVCLSWDSVCTGAPGLRPL